MAIRQFFSDEVIFYVDELSAEETYDKEVVTASAVADTFTSFADYINAPKEQILMSANDKTYAVTIDSDGKLAVEEVVEGD